MRQRILLLPLLLLGLPGCSEVALRKGPSPILEASAVQTASGNQIAIINALANDAGLNVNGTVDYYRVAEAGFNYVDDQCRAYFDEMFFIDRGRTQIKSGLASASATTAAILGLTNASSVTLSIVATAFGFASNASDIVTGTYLYTLPPATTQGLVTKLQIAYRDAAAKIHSDINSPTSAYHHIQNYLALCLPPRIEAEVEKTVGAASAKATTSPSGATIAVESVGTSPQILTIRSVSRPLPPPTHPPVLNPDGLTPTERSLSSKQIMDWQKTLCVTPADGKLGPISSQTRKAVRNYLVSKGARAASDTSDAAFEIGQREKVLLNILADSPPSCPAQ